MTQWHSLYLHSPDPAGVIGTLAESLQSEGYTRYDPFGLMPGRAYGHSVKLFVAPPADGWVRVIVSPENPPSASQLQAVSHYAMALNVVLDGTTARISAFHSGAEADLITTLAAALRPQTSPDCIHAALSIATAEKSSDDASFQAMAGGAKDANMREAKRLFEKLSKNYVPREEREMARALINDSVAQWHSVGGRRIRALMDCLTVSANWREPDYVTLRDAYQLLNRRRRNPNAMLYPGDAEAMDTVPDALDYTPIFAGK